MDIKIYIATHKRYPMPHTECYVPLYVGKNGREGIGYKGDDTGDNISALNPYFCELTGLYYAWKNESYDAIGLVHYRRYFKGSGAYHDSTVRDSGSGSSAGSYVIKQLAKVITKEEAQQLFETADVILPKKRNYYIESLYSHYAHTLYVEPLDETGRIIAQKYPEYSAEFERLHRRKSAHMLNMFLMKKSVADEYFEWLFDILFELYRRTDASRYDKFHARFYGRISELLLDVYLNTNHISYREVGLISTEKVDYLKKARKFLAAKFLKKKYEESF